MPGQAGPSGVAQVPGEIRHLFFRDEAGPFVADSRFDIRAAPGKDDTVPPPGQGNVGQA